MSKRKKIYFWVGGSVGALLILLLVLILLLPRLINLEPLKEKISVDISRMVGGVVEFQKIDLSFFPRPHIVIHQASLSVPGKASGTLESLVFYPKILPLLMAKLHVARLQVKAPDFRIRLPDRPEKKGKTRETFSLEAVKEKVASSLAVATLKAPGLVVVVVNGRLDFLRKDKSAFQFQDIRARVGLPPGKLKVNLTCKSNLWDDISLNGWVNVDDFETSGSIDLTNFRPHILSPNLLSPNGLRVGESELNLNLKFKTEGLKVLQGKVQGSIPYLTLYRGNEKLVVKGKSLKGAFDTDKEKTTVSLTELNLDYPKLSVTGRLILDQGPPRVSLELEGRELDVHSTREAALALAGDIPVMREICDIVKGGKVPLITFNAGGSSMKDLGKLENITIKGNMLEGKILIPGSHLDLEDVNGEMVISKEILHAKNLEAQLGNSRADEGTLKLGLTGEKAPFHLDILLDADLAQLPPILKRLVADKSFAEQIDLIHDLKGHAKGRLVLGESIASIKTRLDVSQFNLAAKYQPIPYPLEIGRGKFFYDGDKIDVKNLSGKLGKSFFSGLSARLDWTKEPYLEVESGKSNIVLDEIYPWLSSFEGLREELKSIGTVKGSITLSALSLKGPLQKPNNWRFETAGEVKDLAVHTSLFSGPIRATQGKFKATPEKLSFTGLRTDFLDASINGDGTLDGYLKGSPEVDMSFEGEMRSKSIQWVSELIKLPSELVVRSPLSISQAHLTRDKGGKISFSGSLAVPDGPKVSMDIIQDSEQLTVKNLLIQDEESNATITLNRKKREFSLSFSGNLRRTTLDTFLVENQFLTGWVKGDFQARVLMDQPMASTAQGKLEGRDLMLPSAIKVPLKIDSYSLDAKKDNLKVESAVFTWVDSRITLKGNVKTSADGFLLDLDLFADNADWKDIRETFVRDSKETGVEKTENSFDLPVRGILRLKMGSFTYDRFTWSPLHANISFEPAGIKLSITEADLCGISTTGTLGIFPQEIQLDFKSVAKGQELAPALTCLVNESALATGKFDFDAKVTARGKSEELAKSLHGNLELTANEGRIYRFGLLAKILALLNVTEIFRGKAPDLKKEGFGYNSVTVKGDLENGKFVLKEAIVDGSSMEIACLGEIDLIDKRIDLKVLVAPLKTIDSVVKKIPLLSHILGGTLVSIPIKITGNLGDPKVTPLSPSAVGPGLLGILKRTVQLPVKMVEPLSPGDMQK